MGVNQWMLLYHLYHLKTSSRIRLTPRRPPLLLIFERIKKTGIEPEIQPLERRPQKYRVVISCC